MKGQEVLFSSAKTDWETPQDVFDILDGLFHFDRDVCATADNTKCKTFYTPEQNALIKPWTVNCFMNPPYGRGIDEWMAKAHREADIGNARTMVCLVPARTDTRWFHDHCTLARAMFFFKGRLKFGSRAPSVGVKAAQPESLKELVDCAKKLIKASQHVVSEFPAPFPSMLAVFGTDCKAALRLPSKLPGLLVLPGQAL